MKLLPALVAAAIAISPVNGALYRLRESYKGRDFFDHWTWEDKNDPTHGRVNYVDKMTAQATRLAYATNDKFFMHVNSETIVPPGSRGRDSNRIVSNAAHGDAVVVIDLQHMPTGCGTWPAFWTLSQAGPWPRGGEIDIIEGVHKNTNNLITLHTTPGCEMPAVRDQTGTTVSSNCDTAVNFNQGCGTSVSGPNSYGADFNENGGGWYVLERSRAKGISVWFWPRHDPFVPVAVRHQFSTIRPDSSWGVPDAQFPTDSCDYDSHFDAHHMIFDTTFCGDWAGAPDIWAASGCGPQSCVEYVDSNPEQFKEAYWEINSVRVYGSCNSSDDGISIGVEIGLEI